MINPMDLSGKTIVVAGASSGIGKETALLLSNLGARLVLIARRENMLTEVISLLNGSNHLYYTFDLSNLDNIKSLVEEIVKKTGPVDGLVYSAGVSNGTPLRLINYEKMNEVFTINLYGFIELSKQISKKKNFNKGTSFVVVSSTASLINVNKGNTIYSCSKASINSCVRSLAHELGEKGIRVNAVAPGMTDTEMFKSFLTRAGGFEGEACKKLLERQYLGIINPKAVANAIAFLLSPASNYTTGIVLPIDSGLTSC